MIQLNAEVQRNFSATTSRHRLKVHINTRIVDHLMSIKETSGFVLKQF
jgi:hypothetical protein